MRHSVDSMILLMHLSLPHINVSAIKNNGIIAELQSKMFWMIKNYQGEEKTPLMIRLAVSVLSYTLTNTDKI